jgi:DNA-damage-inducible protein J
MKTQKTTTLNIRICPDLKNAVESIYQSFGLTVSDAINMFFNKSVMENGLPFELKIKSADDERERQIDLLLEQLEKAEQRIKNGEQYMTLEEIRQKIGV